MNIYRITENHLYNNHGVSTYPIILIFSYNKYYNIYNHNSQVYNIKIILCNNYNNLFCDINTYIIIILT